MKKNEITLRNWLRRYLISMFVLLVVLFAFAQSRLVSMLTQRAEQSIQKSIFIAESGIEEYLESVDGIIYESLYGGTSKNAVNQYRVLKDETDMLLLSEARQNVLASLNSIVSWSDLIDFILVYTEREDGPAWLGTGISDSFLERKEVSEIIQSKIDTGEINQLRRYWIAQGKEKNYMMRTMKIEGSYFVICVSQRAILRSLNHAEYAKNSISFAAESDGSVMFASEHLGIGLPPSQEGTYITIDGKSYLQTGCISERTGYYFGILTEKDGILSGLWVYQLPFFVFSLFLIIMIPLMFILLHKDMEKPIAEIASTMNLISEGEGDARVRENFRFVELSKLAHAFNHMIDRVNKLKIEKYEVQLEAQKATMQYLQMQIKPHFYANALNVIYSLAQRKDYETIQKMSSAIVNYSRYMFHDANEMVEVQREIQHVRYYMEIQEIRYMMQIQCDIIMEPGTEHALIPTFVIQNFVENSVKYGFTTQKSCQIHIRVTADEELEELTILTRDNGAGFSEEILTREWTKKSEDGHVGLNNVYKRLKLIYGEKASIQLCNDHGAVAVIKVPYIAL